MPSRQQAGTDLRLTAWQGSLDDELALLATIPSQHWLHAGRVGPKSYQRVCSSEAATVCCNRTACTSGLAHACCIPWP